MGKVPLIQKNRQDQAKGKAVLGSPVVKKKKKKKKEVDRIKVKKV